MTSKQETKTKKTDDNVKWWSMAVVVVGIAFATHSKLPTWDIPASNKPYRSLREFYPHYLQEHRNTISRAMHIYGTTLVLLLLILKYKQQVPNLLIGISMGMMLCELLAPLDNSYGSGLEFVTILIIPFLLAYLRKQELPIWLPITGYMYAWVGHFLFEKNRPTTFVYPSYSLLCDFLLWFHTLTGKIPATQTLDNNEVIDHMRQFILW